MSNSKNVYNIDFSPLNIKDLSLIYKWMNEEHILKWWGEKQEWTLKKIQDKYKTYISGYKICDNIRKAISAFIIKINKVDVGYIQYYNFYDFQQEYKY